MLKKELELINEELELENKYLRHQLKKINDLILEVDSKGCTTAILVKAFVQVKDRTNLSTINANLSEIKKRGLSVDFSERFYVKEYVVERVGFEEKEEWRFDLRAEADVMFDAKCLEVVKAFNIDRELCRVVLKIVYEDLSVKEVDRFEIYDVLDLKKNDVMIGVCECDD